MKVLMSTIGTRGDVQPLLALAVELRALGHTSTLCVAPNFREWVESYGVRFHPLGPDVRQYANKQAATKPVRPTKAQRRQLAEYTIREQFRVLGEAAVGCDVLVGAGALQFALRSIAEVHRLRYVYVSICPATLPSLDHPPARMLVHYPQRLPGIVNRALWWNDARSFNDLFRGTINEERRKLGQSPIQDVRRHVVSDRPWLAADPVLAPVPTRALVQPIQTGAWTLPYESQLPDDVEQFLNDGEPPLYFGFGSMSASESTGELLLTAARRLGRRAILSQGWGTLGRSAGADDCLVIGDVNHQRLFSRVAAVVHHGGAGTTTAVARAARPQVVVPGMYDQFYFAHRVHQLGIGVRETTRDRLTTDSLVRSLQRCLLPETVARASAVASRMTADGTRVAAQHVTQASR